MYVCGACGREVELEEQHVRCAFCGYRVLYKPRPKVVKRVKAR